MLPIEPFSSATWIWELIAFIGVFISITIIKGIVSNARSQIDIGLYFTETIAIFMLQSITIELGYIDNNQLHEIFT